MGNVSEQVRDIIIIGSGPAGYTAAIYAARAELKPLLFEGSQYGGVLMTTTDVENYPGFRDGIMGPDLMEQFRAQAERFGTQLQSKDVTSVDLTGDLKQVMVDDTTYLARSVILAMGAQPRYLQVPGEQELLGRGVSSCATCDGFFFHDQDVAVIGGGDSAMEEAMFLTKFARSVTVVHRRHEFRASKIMLERARSNEKIRWRTGVTVQQVHGDGGVSHLELSDGSTLDVSGMFVAIGHDPGSELVRDQLDTDADGYVLVSAPSTATSVAAVFAAGDLVDRTYRQAVTAAGTGCSAAIDAERWLAEHAMDSHAEVAAEHVGGGYASTS
ncbi:MAG: thioredoxin-disulfide reductase [Pseudonocardiaceae bacterium]